MNQYVPLADEIRAALPVMQALRAAGIGEDDPDFLAMLEAETDAPERLRKILRAARFAEADAEKLAGMIRDMQERKKRFEAKADTLRAIARTGMESLGLPKLHAPDFTATISTGRPSLIIEDEEAIPTQLCRVKREPDKTAIRKALENGEVIPGAALGPASNTLTVRTK
jgi:hypothetical protein